MCCSLFRYTIKLKLHVQRIDKEVDDKSNVGFSVFIALNGTVKPYGVYRLGKRIDNNTAEPEERKKKLTKPTEKW